MVVQWVSGACGGNGHNMITSSLLGDTLTGTISSSIMRKFHFFGGRNASFSHFESQIDHYGPLGGVLMPNVLTKQQYMNYHSITNENVTNDVDYYFNELRDKIFTIVTTENIDTLNHTFQELYNLFQNELDIDKYYEELNQKFSQSCSVADNVFVGYIGRAYLNMFANKWSAAKHDAFTLQLIDNLEGVKKGGTGITDNRVLAIAFHLLFIIYRHEEDLEGMRFSSDGSYANEPLFAFTNLQRAQLLMQTQDMSIEKNRKEVLSLLSNVIKSCPEYDEAYYTRGLYYRDIDPDNEKANADFERTLKLNPKFEELIKMQNK
jgi:tetratricopeptide (TPR) repeat protein